jgi:hypothetical protein
LWISDRSQKIGFLLYRERKRERERERERERVKLGQSKKEYPLNKFSRVTVANTVGM